MSRTKRWWRSSRGQGGGRSAPAPDIRARLDGDARFPEDHGRRAREAFNSIYECPIPVIGAINGPALGAGLALAASCDYLIASENANFALPEIDVGLMGGARHLGRLFPQGVTRRLHYTADRLPAAEAYRLGAVHKVVPSDQLMDAAMEEAAHHRREDADGDQVRQRRPEHDSSGWT